MSKRDEKTQTRKSGWKQWTKTEARQALAAWKKSGQPLGTFARLQGIGAERLRWWRKHEEHRVVMPPHPQARRSVAVNVP